MVQIAIPDALYRQLQMTAHEQGVSVETYIQKTQEALQRPYHHKKNGTSSITLDQLAQQNGAIPSEEWANSSVRCATDTDGCMALGA